MGLHIDYYVSLNSPWTHLGAARIEAMAMAHGASLRIYPVDFGAIFAQSGGLPLPQRSPQRQAWWPGDAHARLPGGNGYWRCSRSTDF